MDAIHSRVLFLLDVKYYHLQNTLLPAEPAFKSFRGGDNVVIFTFPFHNFMPLSNFWFIRLPGYFPFQEQEVALTATCSYALRELKRCEMLDSLKDSNSNTKLEAMTKMKDLTQYSTNLN